MNESVEDKNLIKELELENKNLKKEIESIERSFIKALSLMKVIFADLRDITKIGTPEVNKAIITMTYKIEPDLIEMVEYIKNRKN